MNGRTEVVLCITLFLISKQIEHSAFSTTGNTPHPLLSSFMSTAPRSEWHMTVCAKITTFTTEPFGQNSITSYSIIFAFNPPPFSSR